jgi:hypothetical protein
MSAASASGVLCRCWAVIALSVWLTAAHAAAQDEERHLVLAVGETAQVPSTDIASFSTSGPETVRVTSPGDGGAIVIEGVLPGRWTLLFVRTDGTNLRYRVHVLAPGEHR